MPLKLTETVVQVYVRPDIVRAHLSIALQRRGFYAEELAVDVDLPMDLYDVRVGFNGCMAHFECYITANFTDDAAAQLADAIITAYQAAGVDLVKINPRVSPFDDA